MRLITLEGGLDRNLCYLAAAEAAAEAVLVDAAVEAEAILQALARERLQLELLVLTHAHHDHWIAAAEVLARTGAALAAFGESGPRLGLASGRYRALRDGEEFRAGGAALAGAAHPRARAASHLPVSARGARAVHRRCPVHRPHGPHRRPRRRHPAALPQPAQPGAGAARSDPALPGTRLRPGPQSNPRGGARGQPVVAGRGRAGVRARDAGVRAPPPRLRRRAVPRRQACRGAPQLAEPTTPVSRVGAGDPVPGQVLLRMAMAARAS